MNKGGDEWGGVWDRGGGCVGRGEGWRCGMEVGGLCLDVVGWVFFVWVSGKVVVEEWWGILLEF